MPEPLFEIDPGIESSLRLLGGSIAYPETPNVSEFVRQSIEAPRAPAMRETWNTGWLATAAAVVLLGLTLWFSSGARDAVGRWIDVPGIRVRNDVATQPAGPSAIRDAMGERTTLPEAAASVSFPVMVVDASLLGDADEVYRTQVGDTSSISLVYLADETLPALADSDVGLLMMQFSSHPDAVWIEKSVVGGALMRVVHVNGIEALWIEGTHNLTIVSDDAQAESRTAGNVLSWHVDGITYRIESSLPLSEVIEIAESLYPAD